MEWFFKLPEMDYSLVAPLVCAGITSYTPIKYHVLGRELKGKVGVVGIGGLGHMALKFCNALGIPVSAISTNPSKEAEARSFGATDFIVSGPDF